MALPFNTCALYSELRVLLSSRRASSLGLRSKKVLKDKDFEELLTIKELRAWEAASDEHGERFHQDITKMESNYQGKWTPIIMGNFCWMILRDIPEAK